MSVEKMEMMNIIGSMEDLDRASMEIVRSGCVHIVNALNEINQNDFTVLTPDQNTNIIMDLCFIKPYNHKADPGAANDKLNELMDMLGIEKGIRRKYVEDGFKCDDIFSSIDGIYSEVVKCREELEMISGELEKTVEFQEDMRHIRDVRLDLDALKNMDFFNFKIGRFTKDNFEKLKDNIENVSSIIYEITSIPGYQVVMSLTPKALEVEVDRIFKSLNYEELNIPFNLGGTPEDIVKKLDEKIREKKAEIEGLNREMKELKGKYSQIVDQCYSKARMYEKIQAINAEVACTNEFFYMAGWVPVSEKKGLQKRLASFGDRLLLIFKDQSEVCSSIIPPTKLKNNWFVRPFEAMVRMYGTPSHNEIDPTSFVAISYMIMFGSMFGDVGQGFIFLAAGIFMTMKNRESSFGGILSRLGISSMVFGALFGSVFGNEEILHPILIRPMENINMVLMGGVALGIAFTTVGFIYSLINAVKRKDLEGGMFGKDGLVGLLFYWIILLTAFNEYRQVDSLVPLPGVIAVLCVLLALMVFKQPVANLIKGRRPLYHEPMQDYYIESGFGVLETLLSMLSNTISFIRVGAFALNHVGLFVAFATIADLMKTSAGSIGMLVLGNVIIIALEGLIVFIQGLRLEYYELFSKYYEGDGMEYQPVKLQYAGRLSDMAIVRDVSRETGAAVAEA